MKKRILSAFMALALCLTLLPTAALAEETEGTAQTSPAVEEPADPANGEAKQENQPAAPEQENQSAEQKKQQEDSASKQDEAVADVQAMIDALPDAAELDGMDDEDAMAVYEAFQAACDAYYDTLTEEQQAQLKNTEKLAALSDWFSQPETLAAGTHQDHCICGKSGCAETGHDEITFDKWLASTASTGYTLVVGGTGHSVYGDGQTLDSNDKYVLNGGNYYLKTGGDFESAVKVEHPIQIKGNVTICLNGQTIESKAEDQPVFEIVTGGKLTLTDCGSAGKVTHFFDGTGCGVEVNGGEFNLYGGSIIGNTAAKNSEGGGVRVCNGTFNMYGGKITGNNAEVSGNQGKGGGVRVGSYDGKKGTFNLYGGEITYNEAKSGGGVDAFAGEFNMYGGEITNNKATSIGGGVFVDTDSCTFNMSGGEIKDNTASSGGGVSIDTGTFNMSGGSITGNTATNCGGGVHKIYGTFTVSGTAVIKDNKKGTANNSADNNVYLLENKFITVSGHLDAGASIGVTTEKTPAAGGSVIVIGKNLTAGDAAKFFSDKGGYAVSVNESKNGLLLVKAHTHYLCGGDECVCNSDPSCGLVTFTAWASENSLPNTAGKYYLTQNVTLSKTWTPANGTVLCLNGHKITMDNIKDDAITVNSGITFTLCDCKDGGKTAYGQITHTITQYGTRYKGRGVYVKGGTFNMYGGEITGNDKASNSEVAMEMPYGGGVYVGSGGTFNLYDGKITNNTATSGGGVDIGFGTFNMYGGEITGNTAAKGGGVYVAGSDPVNKFNMYGGTISGNAAQKDDEDTQNDGAGGGVYIESGSAFTMTGGTIGGTGADEANTATYGGGVYMGGGTFTMSGGAKITKNTATNGGGVYMERGTFTMSGGSISGNSGGGVDAASGTFTMSDGSISGNTASDGGGVRLSSSYSTFNMTGGTITENEATSQGGGVSMVGKFTMSGGSITKNKAGSFGGGVKVTDGTFAVSGGATVTENVNTNGNANNVSLPSTKTITIGTDGLSGTIGVAMITPTVGGVIATSANEDYSGNFISDDTDYQVAYDATKNQLVLKQAEVQPPAGEHKHFLCGKTHKEIGDHKTDTQITFTKWDKTNELPDTGGNWYLTENVTLTETWTPANNTVLCLNGHSIAANGNFNTITVKGGTFTLTDCQSNQGSVTHVGSKYGRGVEVENGTFNLYKGEITGNNGEYINREPLRGGGVMMNNKSAFNMYGGKISGNTGTLCDGGVNVAYSNSTFNLYKGEITGNNGSSGGVYVVGKFNMSGGEIKDNTATISGGVVVCDGAAFNMSGGSITNNTATYSGGVYVYDGATFTVSGAANITGNKKGETDNNVYLSKANETVIGVAGVLTGASIGVTPATWPEGNGQVAIASGESRRPVGRITS